MSFATHLDLDMDGAGTGSTRMTTVTKGKAAVVLIVEDDREMLSLLCDEFWSAEYRLRQARDGDEAFQMVLQSVPDLILTDLRMPAGGPDYISRLKTVEMHGVKATC
jgi:CheY-like chemotaxis protein